MKTMPQKTHLQPTDLHGLNKLATDAVTGVTTLVEEIQHNIIFRGLLGLFTPSPIKEITSLAYRHIRDVTTLVGQGIDIFLAELMPMLPVGGSSPEREAVLAALNGVLGDYLHETNNSLAIPMQLRRNGRPLELTRDDLAATIPHATAKLLIMVPGLCMSDLQWQRQGHDHGALLAQELGYTTLYLNYNSGRHISSNGLQFANILQLLLASWPVQLEKLVIIGHSLGGLVTRSACHYGRHAGHEWVRSLNQLVFLGTPHHGAPLERGGNWLDRLLGLNPYTEAFTRLAKIRSASITDLRYGNLRDEDWTGHDRFAPAGDNRHFVPLPEGVQCFALGATTGAEIGDFYDQLLGDGLVPLSSALGCHANPELDLGFPDSQRWVGYGMGHLDLLNRPEVYQKLKEWLKS
jgi:pimeloyl-ACP methyl ester carboxylesterase